MGLPRGLASPPDGASGRRAVGRGGVISDPLGGALAVAAALPEGVSVILVGGLAANAYRPIARLTQDADVLLWGGLRSLASLERDLLAAGFARPPGRRVYRVGGFEWRRLLWPQPDPEQPSIVDVFLADRGYLVEVARRAEPIEIEGRQMLVASPEDLVLLKLLAIAAGAPRGHKVISDQDDVAEILRARPGSLDVEYIRTKSGELGVLRLANRFLKAAGF